MNRLGRSWALLGILGVAALLPSTPLFASVPTSSNYRFDETSIGTGGLLNSNSANFKATTATGDLSVGSAASTNFQVEAGTQTKEDPTLSFSVNTGSANFGVFSPTTPATTTATFTVKNYTSYGYVAQIVGSPPTGGGYTIDPMASTGSSQVGIEQFGINLVANTSPSSVGANPNNGSFGFGTVTANYNTSNQYRYVSGESIASAPKSSGETTYTITYLVNVSSITPGGQYQSDQTIIVTGTY